ncbi:MAG: redoxin domain-containing protein, partial [Prevotella sp.]|nr:redoxin domain-containing protein [Prevotella sp.]
MNKLFLSLCLLWASVAVGAQERLPKVTLKDLEGRTVQTDTISNNGNPLVVTFFATWCKPCDRELKS